MKLKSVNSHSMVQSQFFTQSFQWIGFEMVPFVFLLETKCSPYSKCTHISQQVPFTLGYCIMLSCHSCQLALWIPRITHCPVRTSTAISTDVGRCTPAMPELIAPLAIFPHSQTWVFMLLFFYGVPTPVCLGPNPKSIRIKRNLFLLSQFISGYFVCIYKGVHIALENLPSPWWL